MTNPPPSKIELGRETMKKITPYRIVAKSALMSWNGLSEQEAEERISKATHAELESEVWAEGSMKSAVRALSFNLSLTEEQTKNFEKAVLGGDSAEMSESDIKTLAEVARIYSEKVTNTNKLTLNILSAIHNDWVKDNVKKFNQAGREGKKYQHLPIEMIGWKETKADLLFLEPILNSIGVELEPAELEETYNTQVVSYFNRNGLVDEKGIDKSTLSRTILKGVGFYPVLTENNTAQSKEEADLMTEQVCEKLSNIKLSSKNK